MKTIQTYTMNLAGTNYEIGYKLGEMMAQITLKNVHTAGMEGFGIDEVKESIKLFSRWCPGLTDELDGFADALKVKPEKVLYYAMTYLLPRCSHVALLPSLTADSKPLVARNYEFNNEMEDFCLVKTCVPGKYTHMGTSVMTFGREDGLNEHGLSVTMSACGFPVGPLPNMRPPALKGLQYWAVIRALLENCKNVDDALSYLEGMPVAFNVNLILADKAGNAALFETIDGQSAYKRIGPDTGEQLLLAANHAVLPALIPLEPEIMVHSAKRYAAIERRLAGKTGITRDNLKEMLLAKYPYGPCCHYFEEFFGTTKSMLLSPADGTIEICWGGRQENGWRTYDINKPLADGIQEIEINFEKAAPGTYAYQSRS